MSRGRPVTKLFRVYDGEKLVAEGTSKECGAALGLGSETIRSAYSHTTSATYKGYRIEEIAIDDAKSDAELDKQAIENWNAFCEPIRKEFGIKIRRFTREELEGKGRGKRSDFPECVEKFLLQMLQHSAFRRTM